MEESGDFSDEGLDEFEESVEDKRKPAQHNSKNQTYKDKPYDEAYEISQDLSMAESFDAREKVYKYNTSCAQSIRMFIMNLIFFRSRSSKSANESCAMTSMTRLWR